MTPTASSAPSSPEKLHGLGNYKGYYTQRPCSSDKRLQYFKREWFLNKKCIDIGCNSGHLTFHVAEKYGPKSMIGIDIDIELIRRARNRLLHTPSASNIRISSLVPRAVCLKLEQRVSYPSNLSFSCCDITTDSAGLLSMGPADTIVCCSVTKWIHLNHGDAGLMKLFRNIFDLATPGGLVILEYQPWKSYERNKNTSETTKAVFKTLQIHPLHFETILVETIGFIIETRLGTPIEEAKGFDRPILLLRRPVCEIASVPPENSMINNTNKRRATVDDMNSEDLLIKRKKREKVDDKRFAIEKKSRKKKRSKIT